MATGKTKEMIERLKKDHAEKLDLLLNNGAIINDLHEKLVGSDKPCDISYFELTSSSLDISFAGSKDDFKRVWKTLRDWNFTPTTRPEEGKTITTFSTSWRSEHSNLVVWMHFSSTECKLVQKGTKMVEQPVWEVQCSTD